MNGMDHGIKPWMVGAGIGIPLIAMMAGVVISSTGGMYMMTAGLMASAGLWAWCMIQDKKNSDHLTNSMDRLEKAIASGRSTPTDLAGIHGFIQPAMEAWMEHTNNQPEESTDHGSVSSATLSRVLDVCQANVMFADADMTIQYLNDSVVDMFDKAEADIKTDLPNFDRTKLLGANVDVFHKNPSHQRNMVSSLSSRYETQITVGGRTFSLVANPVFDEGNTRLGTVVEWYDATEELARAAEQQAIAEENARVRQALDNVTTNAMIADNDGNIVYMNNSVTDMLHNAESDLRKVLPHFQASKLMGANFDSFHKNPAHQRNLLANLTGTYRSQIEVGGRTFSLIANPVISVEGERIGSVVEWKDRTEEVKIENEISSIVEHAIAGDLSSRMREDDKEGFFASLATGLNRLVEVVDNVFTNVADVLSALSEGKLTKTIDADYSGSFGRVKDDTNQTVLELRRLLGEIQQAAQAVSTGADEISQGNLDLSQRTEEQASSLEETASSMEEMTSIVKQNEDNAIKANEMASGARDTAEEGGTVVSEAVQAMGAINESSTKIADIISVIDEIAFQTNLLALNAAVEAARAGEQGRGFAVVAGEVRNLAQRSAAAAREIKDLIRDSVMKVETGTDLVNRSGETLSSIVTVVNDVSTMMAHITESAKEQSMGIAQVNTAVGQMDEMTQQNAALVEEGTAAAESMAQQARRLLQALAFFDLGDNAHMGMAAGSDVIAPPAPSRMVAPAVSSSGSTPKQYTGSNDFSDGDDWKEF